ncbi:MAG: hypothetical protein HY320_10850 [Armatimonadetes bacterium]|nr:hypothetical protein [Armatimonadota bacterium]
MKREAMNCWVETGIIGTLLLLLLATCSPPALLRTSQPQASLSSAASAPNPLSLAESR